MFEKIKCKFLNYIEYYSRVKTLEVLKTLSDRQLEDAGISPHLVSGGMKFYPWREGQAAIPLPEHKPKVKTSGLSRSELKRAEAELRAMTDAELADIGISRGQIPYSVRYGVA